ncbi:hypothetical protein H4219_000542 [Mycoemilia scoparia]|uniref:Uncharacterized protein n=1 Tax=Mycoemilia scoparia TaxID=417184 RepID=A0A9W8ABJ5_9FUNG|nr:hypothetical protein H4219_000542 [Mycoemilia scoparia]
MLSEYEKQRLENIRQNAELLKSLGLAEQHPADSVGGGGIGRASAQNKRRRSLSASDGSVTAYPSDNSDPDIDDYNQAKKRIKISPNSNGGGHVISKQRKRLRDNHAVLFRRQSRRLQGEKPEDLSEFEIENVNRDGKEPPPAVLLEKRSQFSVTEALQKVQEIQNGLELPYKLGYKASKPHFNQQFYMEIEKGDQGPIFVVWAGNSGTKWRGHTPTQPWTKACLRYSSKSTRVSGPLFFGFSDPITQTLISSLDGYQEWDDVQKSSEKDSNDGDNNNE